MLGVQDVATGVKVFDHVAVRGTWMVMENPDDVLDLMDRGADGVVALVRDCGATFLAPIFHELAGVVCTNGTPRSHIGIVSREFQVPCIMGAQFSTPEPTPGAPVELDCSGPEGVLRA
jgi:phosphohistidine swiveling domain-containing protein